MQAIGFLRTGPDSDAGEFVEFTADDPQPGPRDLLVEVRGISVNPVDTKMCGRVVPGTPAVLGYDAAGVVVATGADVQHFQVGDAVFHAGDISRPGSNSALQLVDERIAGRKPSSLDFADAAALPLTSITAWEMLFDCFGLREGDGAGESLLIIGGAGGVGSIMIQLARKLTGLNVIATASRPETRTWVERMGAHHVVDHRKPLNQELATLDIAPRYVAAITETGTHLEAITELIKPRGHIAVIDDPPSLDILPLKRKAISVSWEFMFARPMYQMPDMDIQGQLLNRVADMLDAGELVSTANQRAGTLGVKTLAEAHEHQRSGTAIGKTVLTGLSAASS